MPQLNFADFAPQLVWLAITFIGLYLFLSYVALPRIATVIEERRDRISRDLAEAERLRAETEKAIATYEQALAEARAKAHEIAQETRDKLKEEVDQERAQIEEKIQAKSDAAEKSIAEAKAAALSQVNEVAEDVAAALLDRLTGLSLDKNDISAAVSAAVNKD